jgi:2-polyprenyl-3-methyl-5-hydroxy-6-metoxy-1,4-benzoquinol methylase
VRAMAAPACPACASTALEGFYAHDDLPALCNALWPDRDAALAAPRGDVRLAVCTACGMMTNTAFDPAVFGYSPQYENSLHFSPAFQRYATGVARRLVDEHGLRDVDVVEIGPGSGDFLSLLCRLGGNRGRGYDPSHDPARATDLDPRVTIEAREFPTDGSFRGRLVCARHVLEHVPDPTELVGAVARGLEPGGVAYLEVPDGWYLVDRVALWDVIYEHVHHVTAPALRRLAADAGLRLLRAGTAFGDQFLWADAVRADDPRAAGLPAADPGDGARVEAIVAAARRFGEQARLLLEAAAELVAEAAARGPVVLWGAGSKGVTFLTTVEGTDRIRAAVDINPHKRGRHVPVSGHPVVAPADLVADPPATAIVLNPVYVDEIGAQLAELGLPTQVRSPMHLVHPTATSGAPGAGRPGRFP